MKIAAPPLQGALIGCGFVSGFHLEGWSRVSQARLAALCDLDPQRLDQAAAKHRAVIGIVYQQRFRTNNAKACELIRAGAIGTVKETHSIFARNFGGGKIWLDVEGALTHTGPYDFVGAPDLRFGKSGA